jgi:hypothetical protein
MLRLEFRWWVWLLAALILYVAWTAPDAMATLVGGFVHVFTAVGDFIARVIDGEHASH